jgi:pyruvate-ferredoxin/flavodoxin oxidoreductase
LVNSICGGTLKQKTGFLWHWFSFIKGERRYIALLKTVPKEAEAVFKEAEEDAKRRMNFFKKLGKIM